MDVICELPLDQALEVTVPLLRDSDTQLNTVQQLCTRIASCVDEAAGVSKILRTISSNVVPHPIMTNMLLELLAEIEGDNVIPLISAISEVAGTTREEVEAIAEQYKSLISGDRSLVVPVIGSLASLELTEALKSEVNEMIEAALDIVEEEDFPAVVRAQLRTMTKENGERVVASIRHSSRGISPGILTLVMEVLSAILRVRRKVVGLFLAGFGQSETMSTFDIGVALLILNQPRDKKDARSVLLDAVERGAMTADNLVSVFELGCGDDDKLSLYFSAAISLARALLMQPSATKRGAGKDIAFGLVTHMSSRSAEIVSMFLFICAGEGTSGSIATESECVWAAMALEEMCTLHSAELVHHIPLLEEAVYQISGHGVHDQVLRGVLSALVTLNSANAPLSGIPPSEANNKLLIFLNKHLFSGDVWHQRAGIICAGELLRRGMVSDADHVVQSVTRVFPPPRTPICDLASSAVTTYVALFLAKLSESNSQEYVVQISEDYATTIGQAEDLMSIRSVEMKDVERGLGDSTVRTPLDLLVEGVFLSEDNSDVTIGGSVGRDQEPYLLVDLAGYCRGRHPIVSSYENLSMVETTERKQPHGMYAVALSRLFLAYPPRLMRDDWEIPVVFVMKPLWMDFIQNPAMAMSLGQCEQLAWGLYYSGAIATELANVAYTKGVRGYAVMKLVRVAANMQRFAAKCVDRICAELSSKLAKENNRLEKLVLLPLIKAREDGPTLSDDLVVYAFSQILESCSSGGHGELNPNDPRVLEEVISRLNKTSAPSKKQATDFTFDGEGSRVMTSIPLKTIQPLSSQSQTERFLKSALETKAVEGYLCRIRQLGEYVSASRKAKDFSEYVLETHVSLIVTLALLLRGAREEGWLSRMVRMIVQGINGWEVPAESFKYREGLAMAYSALVQGWEISEDINTTLCYLISTLELTKGLRKMKEVAQLFHKSLGRLYPVTEVYTPSRILHLPPLIEGSSLSSTGAGNASNWGLSDKGLRLQTRSLVTGLVYCLEESPIESVDSIAEMCYELRAQYIKGSDPSLKESLCGVQLTARSGMSEQLTTHWVDTVIRLPEAVELSAEDSGSKRAAIFVKAMDSFSNATRAISMLAACALASDDHDVVLPIVKRAMMICGASRQFLDAFMDLRCDSSLSFDEDALRQSSKPSRSNSLSAMRDGNVNSLELFTDPILAVHGLCEVIRSACHCLKSVAGASWRKGTGKKSQTAIARIAAPLPHAMESVEILSEFLTKYMRVHHIQIKVSPEMITESVEQLMKDSSDPKAPQASRCSSHIFVRDAPVQTTPASEGVAKESSTEAPMFDQTKSTAGKRRVAFTYLNPASHNGVTTQNDDDSLDGSRADDWTVNHMRSRDEHVHGDGHNEEDSEEDVQLDASANLDHLLVRKKRPLVVVDQPSGGFDYDDEEEEGTITISYKRFKQAS